MEPLFNEQKTITLNREPPSAQAVPEKATASLDLSGIQNLIENLHIYGNPLLNASSELLALLVSLPRQVSPLDIDVFRQKLFDAIADFKQRGLFLDYHPSVIEKSCFVICAAFDETILYTPWGEKSRWENNSLLSKIFNQRNGGEVFFTLLEQARRQPAKLVDFLELQYVLIKLGFLGKYRHCEHNKIYELQSELHTLIRHFRDESSLSVPKAPTLPATKKPWCFISTPKLLLISVIIFVGSYLFSEYWYNNRSAATLLAFTSLDMNGFKHSTQKDDLVYTSTPEDIGLSKVNVDVPAVEEKNTVVMKWDILLAVFSDNLDAERLRKELKEAGYQVELNETAAGTELLLPEQSDFSQAKVLKNKLNLRFGLNASVRKSRQQ